MREMLGQSSLDGGDNYQIVGSSFPVWPRGLALSVAVVRLVESAIMPFSKGRGGVDTVTIWTMDSFVWYAEVVGTPGDIIDEI